MARGDDLQDRFVKFAVAIIVLSSSLPKSYAGQHIARQVLRSGTSPAPNYAEARGSESRKDFIHKLRIALKELNETNIWLQILIKSQLMTYERVQPLKEECDELGKIVNASIRTALLSTKSGK